MAAIEPAVHLLKAPPPGCESVLSGDAIAFLTMLARRFEPTRQELLERRRQRQLEIDAGRLPDFLSETRDIRERDWTVAAIRPDLLERRVEITGPVDRKMMINAFNSGPYFYLPKLESHLEARLWNDVFNAAQDALGVGRGTIRATVLIETILAAFETDEILWELRNHSAGLNCGRWDYIFSYIKKFRHRPECLLPDRGLVTMDRPFLKSYAELVIRTCHRRGIHALGGMAAQIPIKRDPALNAQALEKVRQDKLREVRQGHDGTWVAHPALVSVAREVFDAHMPGPHQIARQREDVRVTAGDLLAAPGGDITEQGLRKNLDVALRYLAAWLGGTGCVPIYDLMEDAATAEISRAQVWQWLRHAARLESGRPVTAALVQQTPAASVESLPERVGADGPGASQFSLAGRMHSGLPTGTAFAEFLTTVAYQYLD